MTERNEQTDPEIASFAAKVMRMPDEEVVRQAYHKPDLFRSMAASLVTQAADRATSQGFIDQLRSHGAHPKAIAQAEALVAEGVSLLPVDRTAKVTKARGKAKEAVTPTE